MILCYFPINQNNFLHNVIAGILPQFLKRIPKRIHCALGHNCLGNFLKNANTSRTVCNSRTVCRREFTILVAPLRIRITVLVALFLYAFDATTVSLDDAHVEERLRD